MLFRRSSRSLQWRLRETRDIPQLRVALEKYEHPSGAVHFHLNTDDPHSGFVVAFRTAPPDSAGLPHVLEHIALCGSSKYPVRDPFFLMLRRSLQTFMNAMTYPDFTAYPFSTMVPADFSNLLSVYLDAVFNPRLNRMSFLQEGWRLQKKSAQSPPPHGGPPHGGPPGDAPPAPEASPEAAAGASGSDVSANGLEFAGVVFNEMKGAMADPGHRLFEAIKRSLFDGTLYAHNSGGEPLCIPTLDHTTLCDYHATRYCPANAVVVTYGTAAQVSDVQSRVSAYIKGDSVAPEAAPLLSDSEDVAAVRSSVPTATAAQLAAKYSAAVDAAGRTTDPQAATSAAATAASVLADAVGAADGSAPGALASPLAALLSDSTALVDDRGVPVVVVRVPEAAGSNPVEAAATTIVWRLGDTRSLVDQLRCEMLDRALFGHDGAPLRRALEGCGLGLGLGSCGYEAVFRNGIFMVELRGVPPTKQRAVTDVIMSTLQQIAKDGFRAEDVEAAMHQTELHWRKVRGGRMPVAVQLGLRIVSAWARGADADDWLNSDAPLKALRAEHDADPAAFGRSLVGMLLKPDAVRRTYLTVPDAAVLAEEGAAEGAMLADHVAAIGPDGVARALAEETALQKFQSDPEDSGCLPQLAVSDVPSTYPYASPHAFVPAVSRSSAATGAASGRDIPSASDISREGVWQYKAGTNGIAHAQVIVQLPPLPPCISLVDLPYVVQYINALGYDSLSFAERSLLTSLAAGGASASIDLVGGPAGFVDASVVPDLYLTVNAWGLASKAKEWAALVPSSLARLRTDEKDRVAELLSEAYSGRIGAIPSSAMAYAASRASAALGGTPAAGWLMGGDASLQHLRSMMIAPQAVDGGADAATLAADGAAVESLLAKVQAFKLWLAEAPLTAAAAVVSDADSSAVADAVVTAWRENFDAAVGRETRFVAGLHPPRPLPSPQSGYGALSLPGALEAAMPAFQSAETASKPVLLTASLPVGSGAGAAMLGCGPTHPDAAALIVAARVAADGQLHRLVREEGGAYGSSCRYSATEGTLTVASYRDPSPHCLFDRVQEAWRLTERVAETDVRNAIFATVAGMDKPGTPAGEALRRFSLDTVGIGVTTAQSLRERVLATTTADVRRVVEQYFHVDRRPSPTC